MNADGHVFIVRGDLTKISCDMWLMPSDAAFIPEREWFSSDDAVPSQHTVERIHGTRLARFAGWTPTDGAARTEPIMADVVSAVGPPRSSERQHHASGGDTEAGNTDGGNTEAGNIAAVRDFVAYAAAAGLKSNLRSRPLLAIPFVGTHGGGLGRQAGTVITQLLPVLYESVRTYTVDIALVMFSEAAFAAGMQARRNLSESLTFPRWLCDPNIRERAEDLARHARDGRLAIFAGAGISMGAGLPSWDQLLSKLEAAAGIELNEGDKERMDHLDRAHLISVKLKAPIEAQIAEEIARVKNPSISHCILASMPCNEYVTTNYDCLLEVAATAAKRQLGVLPYQTAKDHEGWILKLHGSVNSPTVDAAGGSDIVITRDHYLSYDANRSALKGIVQAMLMTKHMLFVGFSMTDSNFHAIVHDVLKVRSPTATDETGAEFGSVIAVFNNTFAKDLWGNVVHWTGFADRDEMDTKSASRRLEIFLDFVASEAFTGSPWLLNEDFEGLLDDEQRGVKAALLQLERAVPSAVPGSKGDLSLGDPAARDVSAWDPIRALLASFNRRSTGATGPVDDEG